MRAYDSNPNTNTFSLRPSAAFKAYSPPHPSQARFLRGSALFTILAEN